MANETAATTGNNQTDPAAQAAADKAAADQATSDKAAADKTAADAATAQASDKAAADKAVADKAAADAAAAAKPAAAPEKYEAFVAPEGVTLDADVIGVFEGVAKELGLPQDKAQLVIDKIAPAMNAQSAKAIGQARADMLAAAKADTEIGGEKFDESVAVAKLAIDAYFKPDFAKFLNDTGLGNHPEMIRGLHKAGLQLKQDGFVPGSKGPEDKGAQAFYDKSTMNP